jgi:Uncharacterized protein conserved in bacteria (DUF2334)
MTDDEWRSARLLFAGELARGELPTAALERREVRRAVRARPVPPRPLRLAQSLALKRGVLGYERDVLGRLVAARRAALGDRGAGPPRLLVRMDEFPHARACDLPERYGTDAFRRFHEIMRSAGVPYLLAVLPRPCYSYLDPNANGDRPHTDDERSALADACTDGVEPALHGLTHRTRDAIPRRHSELAGLDAGELRDLLDRGMAELAEAKLEPRVFVPPFNRFDGRQYPLLAERFEIVCGGPESVAQFGFHATPLWRGDAVYLPSYPSLYGTAEAIEPALRRVVAAQPGTWVPVTLHLGWEADQGWTALARLAETMAPYARPWSELLGALDGTRV